MLTMLGYLLLAAVCLTSALADPMAAKLRPRYDYSSLFLIILAYVYMTTTIVNLMDRKVISRYDLNHSIKPGIDTIHIFYTCYSVCVISILDL